jgi:exopolysaccharide biosynthesis polyprenyl glycosylphosphotransferase
MMLKQAAEDAGLRFLDLLAVAASLPIAYVAYERLFHRPQDAMPPLEAYGFPLVVMLILWVASAWFVELYARPRRSLGEMIARAGRALALVSLITCAVVFASKQVGISRLMTGIFFVTAGALLCANRVALRWVNRALRRRGHGLRHYAVVGNGELADEIVSVIASHPEWGMSLAGYVLEDGVPIVNPEAVVLGHVSRFGRILEEHVLDEVVFAVPRERLQGIEGAVRLCEEQGVGAMIALDVLRYGYTRMSIGEMDGLPMLALTRTPTDVLALAVKRAFDVLVSATALLVASPVLALVAIAIRVETPGPVLFRQRRVGRNGRLFEILKFRSMHVDAECRLDALRAQNEMSGPVFKMRHDPRVTRVGRFIRRTSLDEFPQFWNVLRGDMSVVGPRPPLPSEVRQYQRWQRRRLSVKPGITCIWQISGRNEVDFDRWMELDLEYIDHWSLWGDVRIALKTIPAILGARGAE